MTKSSNQTVRGTKDLFGKNLQIFNHIINIASQNAKNFNFLDLQTPIFEFSEIFERNLGSESPLKLDRGINNLWNKGGIMYSPPLK